MPTRKFSEEQVTGTIQDTDLLALTRDPSGTPVSWVTPALVLKNYVGAGAGLTTVTPADFGSYTLPNGGTVLSAAVTAIAGNTIGSVDDMLLFSVTDPTPALGPVIVSFPLTLLGGVPSGARLVRNRIPGSIPVDYFDGVTLDSTVSTSLMLYANRAVAPGPTYSLDLLENDALSGSPASWTGRVVDYAGGEYTDLTFRKVVPFAASPLVPQWELDVTSQTYAASPTDYRSFYLPVSATSGTFNDAGTWDGTDITGMSVVMGFGSAHVGTVTMLMTLRKNF